MESDQHRRAWLPWSLIGLRLALGPAMIALAASTASWRGAGLVAALWLGILSDIFDGIIARRLGVASARLRRTDSQVDLVFWLCVAGSAALARPELLRTGWPYVAAVLGLEAMIYLVSYSRFRREPCTHAYSAKAWGLVLLGAFTAILGFGGGVTALLVAAAAYLVSWVDVMGIILILPRWERDVPSVLHAWRIRQGRPIRRHGLFHS